MTTINELLERYKEEDEEKTKMVGYHKDDVKDGMNETKIVSLNQYEPPPVKNDNPAVWDLVQEDIKERDLIGEKKYGVRLQPHNGRDALIDLYQELMDALVYTRQLIYERDGK